MAKETSKRDTVLMSVNVTMGKARRELVFPVPAAMEEWLEQLKAPEATDGSADMGFTLEGNRNIEILVTTQGFRRKF